MGQIKNNLKSWGLRNTEVVWYNVAVLVKCGSQFFKIKNSLISKMGSRYNKESPNDTHWGLVDSHYKLLYHNSFPCKPITTCSL